MGVACKNSIYKVFLLAAVCGVAFFATYVEAATMAISPNTGVHTVGGSFSVQVRLNTEGDPINAAEGQLSFDPQKLRVTGISKGSIFNLWTVEPTFSNSAGTITFGGGSPAGYRGSAGTIATIRFSVLSAGDTDVRFTSGSALAADGLGTNVLSGMGRGAFTLVAKDIPAEPEVIEYIAPANTPAAPVVSSATHVADGWSTEKSATLSWTLPADVTSVRTLLDGNSGSIPTKVYETPISEITIEDLDEGVQYFHIQFRNSDGWGRVAHYRIAVDSEKPDEFTISLAEDADLSAPEQTLMLAVEDATSAVERYLVQLNGGEPYEFIDETGSSTLALPPLEPGFHSVIIEAFDQAGNSTISTFSFSILAFDKPQFTEYPSEINSEVIPVISGITRPESTVTVTVTRLSSSDSTEVTYDVTSDAGGVFTFIPDSSFDNGVYELIAVATDKYGAQSEPSDPIKIAVQEPGYIQVGSMIVSVLSVLVPMIALVLLSMFMVIFFVARMRKVRRVVITETKEAVDILHQEFDAIEAAIVEESDKLKKSRKTKKLTKAEDALVVHVSETVAAAKKRVEKEIKEVDDIVE